MHGCSTVLLVVVVIGGMVSSGCGGGVGGENSSKGFCGNLQLDPGEECDDGPMNSDLRPDACRSNCRLPRCGDSVVDAPEECDGALPGG